MMLFLLLSFLPLPQAHPLSYGDYEVDIGERGLRISWQGEEIIDGSYLRLARPNYQGEDYLYFRGGKVKREGKKLAVEVSSPDGALTGVYEVEEREEGVLVSLKLKLERRDLPPGPKEYSAGMFPTELIAGCEYEAETLLGKTKGKIPPEVVGRGHDYPPAFVKARIHTNKGFDIVVQSLSEGQIVLHDARGSDWFPPEDRKVWLFPSPTVGVDDLGETTLLIRCEKRMEKPKEEGRIVIKEKGKEHEVKGVVLSAEAHPVEKGCAEELIRYLKEMTGKELRILSEKDLEGKEEGWILVGRSDLAKEWGLFTSSDFGRMHDDGFVIRARGGNLFLGGKTFRGTVYAVYKLLELLGCGFYSREYEVVPQRKRVEISSPLEIRENPAFEWRFFDATIDTLKCYLDAGINDEAIGKEKVPAVLASPFFWHHPMNGYIPIAKYGEAHPEYYTFMNGRRHSLPSDYSGWAEALFHPCLSNPEVRKVILGVLLPLMDSKKDAKYFTVHVGDSDFWCECPRCRDMDVDPNIKSDRVVQFTNEIADVVAREHPDKFVTFLAYVKAYNPPLKAKPRENALAWFCPISACQIHPWRAKCNEENLDVLQGWANVHPSGGRGILTFDYPMNYIHHIVPFPAMFAYIENLKLYQRLHIRGVYICGMDARGHLVHLFSYVVPRMMWNPNADREKIIDEFLKAWFGAGAPYMKKYLSLLERATKNEVGHFNPWTLPPKELFPPSFFQEAYRYFSQAEKACKGDELILRRLWKEKAGLLYADLMLYGTPPKATVEGEGSAEAPSKEQLEKITQLLKIASLFKWSELSAGTPMEDFIGSLLGYRPQTYGWAPWWEDRIIKRFLAEPQRTFQEEIKPRLLIQPLILENEEMRVAILPNYGGRIWSIYNKRYKVELLWQTRFPLFSGGTWRDLGGYEEYVGEEFGGPGWQEPYEHEISPDRTSIRLRHTFPNGLTLIRRISFSREGNKLKIESILRNESPDVQEGACIRVHPEFIFGIEGREFWLRQRDGSWRRVDVHPEDNHIPKEALRGGAWAIVDAKKKLALVNEFDPSNISSGLVYWGRNFSNLELFSLRKDLKPGEEISLEHYYHLMPSRELQKGG